jgi:hypothetical protein
MRVSRATILAITALILACGTGQPERPTILSGVPVISYRIGDELHESTWRLDPELQPDTLFVDLEAGETVEVCFVTDLEEFCRTTAIGETHDSPPSFPRSTSSSTSPSR